MGIGYAVKELRLAKGYSQRKLAELTGLTQPAIVYLEKSDPDTTRFLPQFASAFDMTPEELQLRARNSTVHSVTVGQSDSGVEYVLIPEYRIFVSAGSGETHVEYEVIEDSEPKQYDLRWFQKRHINPDRCKRFKVVGDSMEPLLYDRDSVLVYHEPPTTPIRDGYVYVIRFGSDLRIKRVVKNLDGSITLRSVNPMYHDYVIPAEEVDTQFEVIGRVVDKSGEGGLGG